MEQYGFYVNTDICTGCKACMTACFDRNNLEAPRKFRKVFEFGGGEWASDELGAYTTTSFGYYVSMTCGHCAEPACVERCPTGAMQKDLNTGIVDNDKDLCIGCMLCEQSCPYGHPTQKADGLSSKCVLCSDENEAGVPDPACVKACPLRAIEFGFIADMRSRHGAVDALGELTGSTIPNVVFNPHRDSGKGGTLLNPFEVTHKQGL